MKTLITYHSEHHGNTEKIARAISTTLDAELLKSQNIKGIKIEDYELIGFGSGIYYGKFHQELYRFVRNSPEQNGTKSFIFSTTGSKSYSEIAHKSFTASLVEKGFNVIGEFSCLGFDTALSTEGINKGRPNTDDLQKAVRFAKSLKKD